MRTRILVLGIGILVLIQGCTSDPPMPHVRFIGDVTADDVDAASAWEPLGFTVQTEDSELVECDLDWYLAGHSRDCQITIAIVRDPLLRERRGTNAQAEIGARIITIDSDLTDYYGLLVAVAHETGHILLDTPEHTQGGIMGGSAWSMADVDYALACRTIGVGC